ncbi:MAG TPA: Gfo/Idh/MocA family oxidoreductase, partial [Candidatus Dormibacteraeota bacterium]|nr:Gfo/Idh/MocA family oxidoreductase [Candidatus Dormibacteraeota bacterium]
ADADRSNDLRVAVVGLGWVGTHRHLPWLRRTPGMRVVGVIDHSPARVERALARFGSVKSAVADGPEGVPWLSEVDAVTIATPPATHHPLALAYLKAGKDVLLEKPMALTVDDARELLEVAENAGRMLAIVHNFQFARSVVRLRRLLAEGRLGEVRAVWGAQLSNPQRRLPEWYESLPLGLFFDESPHFFYLVRSVVGAEPELELAHLVPSRTGGHTPAAITLVMRAGEVPVQISMNFEAPVSEWHLTVLGSRGLAVVDVFRDVLVLVPNDREHLARHIITTTASAVSSHLAGVAGSGIRLALRRLAYGNDIVMERFAEACRTRIAPKGISARDGLEVVRLQRAVLDRVHAPAP